VWVSHDDWNSFSAASVGCTLEPSDSNGPNWGQHSDEKVSLGNKSSPRQEPPVQDLALMSARYTDHFTLSCDLDGTQVTAHWIKIMAMRAGNLKRAVMDAGQTVSFGSGTPQVVYGYQYGDCWLGCYTDLSKGVATTIGTLKLDPGAWAIRTVFTFQNLFDFGSLGNCTLTVNGQARDTVSLKDPSHDVVVVMDTAVATSIGLTVKLACTGNTSGATYYPEAVYGARIMAVKLGYLASLESGNYHTWGSTSAWPFVRYLSAASHTLFQPQWTTVASLNVGSGSWMVQAKVHDLTGGGILCRLEGLPDYDTGQVYGWGYIDVPLAVVHVFPSGGSFNLKCWAPSATLTAPVKLSNIRLTAYRLGSLSGVPV
jgi:hypothetical protein